MMKRLVRPGLAPACLLLALANATARGSEEEFLRWSELRLVTMEHQETGPVVLVARVAGDGWQSVKLEAFGQQYQLTDDELGRLGGFPLSSLRTTYAADPAAGGQTVYLRLDRTHYRHGRLTRSEIMMSLNRQQGLSLGEPRHRVLAPPAERPSTLRDALEIAQQAVRDDARFQGRALRSVGRARAWQGPREGEPVWRVDWMAGPGPAYFVEVFGDGDFRVVVAGR